MSSHAENVARMWVGFGIHKGVVPSGDRWTRWLVYHDPCPWPVPSGQMFEMYRREGETEWRIRPVNAFLVALEAEMNHAIRYMEERQLWGERPA